jgi:hypothetical protein
MDDEIGVLKPEVRALVDGRHFNPQRRRDKHCPTANGSGSSCSCRESIRRSFGAHWAALAAAERGRDPREGGFSFENVCWLFQRRGPMTWTAFSQDFGFSVGDACAEIVPRACAGRTSTERLTLQLLIGTSAGAVARPLRPTNWDCQCSRVEELLRRSRRRRLVWAARAGLLQRRAACGSRRKAVLFRAAGGRSGRRTRRVHGRAARGS